MPNGNPDAGDGDRPAPAVAVSPPANPSRERVVYVETAPLGRQPEDAPAFEP